MLTNRVNNPDCTGGFLQGTNSSERLLKFGQLALLEQQFLLGKALSGVLIVDLFKLFHPTQALGDGLEVGQQTTEPTLVHVGLAHSGGLLGHRLLGLLLCSDKQHRSAMGNGFPDEVVCLVNVGQGLL